MFRSKRGSVFDMEKRLNPNFILRGEETHLKSGRWGLKLLPEVLGGHRESLLLFFYPKGTEQKGELVLRERGGQMSKKKEGDAPGIQWRGGFLNRRRWQLKEKRDKKRVLLLEGGWEAFSSFQIRDQKFVHIGRR